MGKIADYMKDELQSASESITDKIMNAFNKDKNNKSYKIDLKKYEKTKKEKMQDLAASSKPEPNVASTPLSQVTDFIKKNQNLVKYGGAAAVALLVSVSLHNNK